VEQMKKLGENKWVLEVQEDPETGDCILEFPPEMLAQVGWKEGDTLEWKDAGNGAWSIAKKDTTVSTETDS
jgi:hypothetical protein